MRLPTTIRGYVSMFRKIETNLMPSFMTGFDDLPEDLQKKMTDLSCYISNEFNEIEAEYLEHIENKKQ
jgi:hypothetical protein